MDKIKILGIGNEGKFNYIIVKKNKDFFVWLSKIFYDSFKHSDDFIAWDEVKNKKGQWVMKKKQVNKIVDYHESYGPNNVRANIFYGENKIFLTFISSLEDRIKFMKSLKKYSIWKKQKIKKKIRKVIKKL